MKATHPKIAALAALSAVAVSLSACGDDVTKVTKIEENHDARVVASVSEVRCNGTTGEMVFSQEDNQLYVCAGSQWISMKGRDGADGQDGKDGNDGLPGSSGGSGNASGGCTVSHVSMVGTDGVVVTCGNNAPDTLWSGNAQVCGSEVYDITYQFCDHRDNQIYKWKKFGNQIWMTQNLNFGRRISAGSTQAGACADSAQKYCRSNDASYCTTYGGLYQWHSAMGFSSSAYDGSTPVADGMIRTPHRGICPEGWHLPTREEWTVLKRNLLGYDFTNGYICSGYSSGSNFYSTSGTCSARWWTASEDGLANSFATGMSSSADTLSVYYGANRALGYSVRCVKD